jgi:hypothetical protein
MRLSRPALRTGRAVSQDTCATQRQALGAIQGGDVSRRGTLRAGMDLSQSSRRGVGYSAFSRMEQSRISAHPAAARRHRCRGGSTGGGFVDVAHFSWVHQDTFADRDNATVSLYGTRETDHGLRVEYWSDVSNYPKAQQQRAPADFRWLRVFDIHPPFAAALTVHFPNDGRLCILNLASPVSARRTRLFVPLARNSTLTGLSMKFMRSTRKSSRRIRPSSNGSVHQRYPSVSTPSRISLPTEPLSNIGVSSGRWVCRLGRLTDRQPAWSQTARGALSHVGRACADAVAF